MAKLGGAKYLRDLAGARRIYSDWVLYYAKTILQDEEIVSEIKVYYEDMHPSSDAYAQLNYDGTVEVVVNDEFFEANIYNLQSEDLRGLIVHEICHLKVFIDDAMIMMAERPEADVPDIKHANPRLHADKRYINCVKQYCHERHARACSHPGRVSFKNYFGSSQGMVPVDIFYIYRYYCPKCDHNWVVNVLGEFGEDRAPTECLECGGPFRDLKHLTPREVLRYDVPDEIIAYV